MLNQIQAVILGACGVLIAVAIVSQAGPGIYQDIVRPAFTDLANYYGWTG